MIRFGTLEAQLRWWLFLIHVTAQHVAIGRLGPSAAYCCTWLLAVGTIHKRFKNKLKMNWL